jgi:hypothetical protein
MKPEARYDQFVRWSDEDQCYIGYCPGIFRQVKTILSAICSL